MVPKFQNQFIFVTMVVASGIMSITSESPEVVAANGRALQQVLVTSMKQPESVSRLVEVMPLLRSLTRTQRVGLAEMLQQAPRVAATMVQQGVLTGKNATLGRLLPQLDVVSLLRRGDEEAQREQAKATRARALEIVEAAVSVPDTQFTESNTTEETTDLPTAQELNSRRQLLPSELLALIAAHRRSGSSWPRPSSNTIIVKRPAVPERVSVGLQPPPMPPGSVDECTLIGTNMCLEAPDYPRESISASLLRSKDSMMARESDVIDATERRDVDENLVSSEPPGSALCTSFVKFAKPKRARNLAGHWKYIVNTGEDHVQTVRIEMCKEAGESCNFLATGVASQCTQVFSNHRLMAWDKEHGLHLDIFKVPTCCSCHVQPAYGPAVFPAVTFKPRQTPPPIEAEPEFHDDEDVAAQEQIPTSRPPPLDWERPVIRRRRPSTMAPPLGKPTFSIPPKPAFASPAPVHETSTYPPVFNKDMRKRLRPLNKNRHDLDDSESISSSQRRRRPVAISSDKIRNSDIIAGDDHSRINYSYHPIIDFFLNEQTQNKNNKNHHPQPQETANRRMDTINDGDDWRPMSPSRHIPLHRGI